MQRLVPFIAVDELPGLDIDAVREYAPTLVARAAVYNTTRDAAHSAVEREHAARQLDGILRMLPAPPAPDDPRSDAPAAKLTERSLWGMIDELRKLRSVELQSVQNYDLRADLRAEIHKRTGEWL